jgi:hypothetical protein
MSHLSYAYLSNDTVDNPDELTNTAILLVTIEFHSVIDSTYCINMYILYPRIYHISKEVNSLNKQVKTYLNVNFGPTYLICSSFFLSIIKVANGITRASHSIALVLC